MKRSSFIFFILQFFVCCAFSVPYKEIQLDTSTPEAGKTIGYVYKGASSGVLIPKFTLYYDTGEGIKWITVYGKQTGKGVTGSFIIPDPALAFCIKPAKYKDVNEAFVFPVFKAGQPIAGAYAKEAQFYSGSFYSGFQDKPKAIELFQKEFQRNPALKQRYLLAYYRNGIFGSDAVGAQMEKTWLDSIQHGKDEKFMFQLYQVAMGSSYGDDVLRGRLKAELLARYPLGEQALNEALPGAMDKMRKGDFSALGELEEKFAEMKKAGRFEQAFYEGARILFKTGKFAEADVCLLKLRNAETKKNLCIYGAEILLKSNKDLTRAVSYIQQAIELQQQIKMPYYIKDEEDWQKTQLVIRGSYLALYSRILYQQNKVREALNIAQEAQSLNTFDPAIREHYLKCLLEAGDHQQAMDMASAYILADKSSDQIRAYLHQAYLETKETPDGYNEYYKSLIRKVDASFVLPDYSKVNTKRIDFALKNIKGLPVSLADYKGKTVVLYFFSPNYSNFQRDSTNSYINRQAGMFSLRKDIVLLGVDHTSVFEADEVKRSQIRIQKINELFSQRNYSFTVLLDDYHYDPRNSGNCYFEVASAYTADSMCQFLIIDKKGIVRYKSYPTSETTPERFAREFSAALKLVE
jgi:alkyl hydroperoxide reductase subunit AhpC